MRTILAGVTLILSAGLASAADATAASAEPTKPGVEQQPVSCLRETGTRIPTKPGECVSAPGTSYSREVLQETGRVNLDDALRQIDPRIR